MMILAASACAHAPDPEVNPSEVPGLLRQIALDGQGDVGHNIGGGFRLVAISARGRTLSMKLEVSDPDREHVLSQPGEFDASLRRALCSEQGPAIRAGARIRTSFVDRAGDPLATTLLTSCPGKA